MAQQGTYPLGLRTLADTDTLTGVVTGTTADVPVGALRGLLASMNTDLAMNGHRVTGAAAAAATGQVLTYEQLHGIGGAQFTGYKAPEAGAVNSTVQTKLQESLSVEDFGAVGDGVTDDTAAFVAAGATNKPIRLQAKSYKIAGNNVTIITPFLSYGATLLITGSNTYLRNVTELGKIANGRTLYRDSAEYTATPTNYTNLFQFAGEHIKHSTSLGYQQNFTSDSGGRTMQPTFSNDGSHQGYGDTCAFYGNWGISKHPSWASISSSWTGANSATIVAGQVSALSDRTNLYGAEFHLFDGGFDRVAANGIILDFAKNNATPSITGAYKTVWTGVRVQTSGLYDCDAAFSVNGKWRIGVDFTGAIFPNKAALTLKTDDRIYYGCPATTPPSQWYSEALSSTYTTFDGIKLVTVVNSVACLQTSDIATVITGGVSLYKGATLLMDVANAIPNKIFIGNSGYEIQLNQTVGFTGQTLVTSATAGTASALPALPYAYLTLLVNGSPFKLPLYL